MIIALVGPTAIGKSEIAVKLAQRLDAEIISADSMQIYRGMDIGTAKPDQGARHKTKHHLIDIVEVDKRFTVAEFQCIARTAISEVEDRQHIPIVVGGSGLYVRAVLDNLDFPPEPVARQELRQRLEQESLKKGVSILYERLKKVDPESAALIHPNNTRRIIRALEVYETTGNVYSSFPKVWKDRTSLYDVKMIGLQATRPDLNRMIDRRVDRMIQNGFVEEVKLLIGRGLKNAIKEKRPLGYMEMIEYIDGKTSLDEAIDSIKRNTHRFAKRQMTWFRRDERIRWYQVTQDANHSDIVEKIESHIGLSKKNMRDG